MATFTDTVKLVFEAATGAATAGVAQLDASLEKAGKTSTGLQGALNRTGAAVDMLNPIAVGGALAAAGFAAAKSFESAAIAASDMADATGLSVEQASRWQEVARDTGVSTEALSAAVNKMNREAAGGGLRALGISAQGTNDQLLAVLTYLNKIPDANRRAAEGTRLLGRGWQEIAPLIAGAADDRERLAAVSKEQVFNAADVARAKQLRDNLDTLDDTATRVKLSWGREFAAGLNGLVVVVQDLGSAFERLPKAPGWLTTLAKFTPPMWPRDLAQAIEHVGDSSAQADHAVAGATGSLRAAGLEADDLAPKLDDIAQAADTAAQSVADLADALVKSREAARSARAAQADAALAVAELGKNAHPTASDVDDLAGKLDDLVTTMMNTGSGTSAAVLALRDLQLSAGRGSPAWWAIEQLIQQLNTLTTTDTTVKVTVDTSAASAALAGLRRDLARTGSFGLGGWETASAANAATVQARNNGTTSRVRYT